MAESINNSLSAPCSDVAPRTISLLTVVAIDTTVTLILVLCVMICLSSLLGHRTVRKEERDKICVALRDLIWQNEDEISRLLNLLQTLKKNIIFRDITEFHIFAHRCRTRTFGSYSNEQNEETKYFRTAAKIEHLFERLCIELPMQGRCPNKLMECLGGTLNSLYNDYHQLWTDKMARIASHVMRYFCRFGEIECRLSDAELETMLNTKILYISNLILCDNFYIFKNIPYSSAKPRPGFQSKLYFIDSIFTKPSTNLESRRQVLVNAYETARTLCLKHNIIVNKNLLPNMPDSINIKDVLMYLRHILRTMVSKIDCCDDSLQLLIYNLYDELYWWSTQNAMFEMIQGTKRSIMNLLDALTLEQTISEEEHTKQKLEEIEQELQHHITNLAMPRTKRRSTNKQTNFVSFESDTSVYTLAMSASNFGFERQPGSDKRRSFTPQSLDEIPEYGTNELKPPSTFAEVKNPQIQSLDATSALSGSTVYETAASSDSQTSENTPLMTPSTKHKVSQVNHIPGEASPCSLDSDYFETAV